MSSKPTKRELHPGNTSGYRGVSRWGKKFQAAVCVNKKMTHVGLFDNMEEAAVAHDQAAVKLNLPKEKLNWPDGYPEEILKNRKRKLRATNSTGYNGVSKCQKRFRVTLRINKKKKNFGVYDTAEEAAVVHDQAVIKHDLNRQKLNFPNGDVPDINVKRHFRKKNSTGYNGVLKHGKAGWRAEIRVDGKQLTIGVYDTTKEAAIEYDRALIKYDLPKHKLNFPNKNYKKAKKLFELNRSDQKKSKVRRGGLI
jgi:hypothetical protein